MTISVRNRAPHAASQQDNAKGQRYDTTKNSAERTESRVAVRTKTFLWSKIGSILTLGKVYLIFSVVFVMYFSAALSRSHPGFARRAGITEC